MNTLEANPFLSIVIPTYNREKFLVNSVLSAIYTGLSTCFLGKHFGAPGMVIGYLVGDIVIGLIFGTRTFTKYRRIWHAN